MKTLLPSLLAILLLGACSFNYGNESGEGAAAKPDAMFTDFVHVVMSDQVKAMELRATKAESYEVQGLLVLSGVTFTQYDRGSGKVSSTGQADKAVFHTDTENAELSGNIVLDSLSEDAKLKAESLGWDSKKKTLEGGLDRTVLVLKGDGTWIRGAGFQSDTRRRSVSFREAVEGALVAQDQEAP